MSLRMTRMRAEQLVTGLRGSGRNPDSTGSRDAAHSGKHDGRVGEFNTGNSGGGPHYVHDRASSQARDDQASRALHATVARQKLKDIEKSGHHKSDELLNKLKNTAGY